MLPRTKTALKVGAVGFLPNLAFPLIGSIAVGVAAGYYVAKQEKFATKKEGAKAGVKAGLIANGLMGVVPLALLLICLIGFPIASNANDTNSMEVLGFGIVLFVPLAIGAVVIYSVLGLCFGGIAGYFATETQDAVQVVDDASANHQEGTGTTGDVSITKEIPGKRKESKNIIFGLGSLALLCLAGIFILFNFYSLSNGADRLIHIRHGQFDGTTYTPTTGNFTCQFNHAPLLGTINPADGFNDATGIGHVKVEQGSPGEYNMSSQSLTYYPLSKEELTTLRDAAARGDKNKMHASQWIAATLKDQPASIVLTNEMNGTEDVFAAVRLVDGTQPTYTSDTKDLIAGLFVFIRGGYVYELTFTDAYIAKDITYVPEYMQKVQTKEIKGYLEDAYNLCNFKQ